jgi:hypothetical protein
MTARTAARDGLRYRVVSDLPRSEGVRLARALSLAPPAR